MARLRKLKERGKAKLPKLSKSTPKKVSVATTQIKIEEAKFYAGPKVTPTAPLIPSDLPASYGKDKIVLQTRDPWWLHAYWEVTPNTWGKLKQKLKSSFFGAKTILRVYDISHIIFDGTNAHRFFDIEINPQANNWYIDTAGPGRSWCVDLGLRLANREFIKIVRSNTAHTPIDGPSWITDEEWMIPEDLFARLYSVGVGFGSSPAFSVSSPVKKVQEKRKR